jgi:glycosyltransferase involved in cell wall biosynthesis
MHIVICTMQVPFEQGGAELLVSSLKRELVTHGHRAEVVQLPLRWHSKEGVMKGYLAWRLLDLSVIEGQRIDVLIATKFPSFVVPHRNKVTWLIQQFRQVYDLYGSEYSPYGHRPEDGAFQQIIHRADTRTLAESRNLFTISQNVANRLAHFNGLRARVLYPPPQLDGRFYHDGYGDYVLTVSRLNVMKRIDTLVQAMAQVRTDCRCLIAGQGPEEEALKRLARSLHVDDRVQFLGYVDDKRLLSLYANAMAVYYAPYDEDYGYATVEAYKAHKPVLTASDSGGVLEFVTDGETGYVVAPGEPRALAERVDQLFANRSLCQRMGEAGYEIVRPITWKRTITELLGGM